MAGLPFVYSPHINIELILINGLEYAFTFGTDNSEDPFCLR